MHTYAHKKNKSRLVALIVGAIRVDVPKLPKTVQVDLFGAGAGVYRNKAYLQCNHGRKIVDDTPCGTVFFAFGYRHILTF